MWLSGIMAIMNSKRDRASPWKIPLWMFPSANLLPPAVNSTLQVFMVLSMKFMTSSDILYILRLFIIYIYIYIYLKNQWYYSPLGWSCTIHRLPFCRRLRTTLHSKCPGYYTKLSDGETPGALRNVKYPFIATPLKYTLTGVVVPDRVPSMGEIELSDHLTVCKQMTNVKLNC